LTFNIWTLKYLRRFRQGACLAICGFKDITSLREAGCERVKLR